MKPLGLTRSTALPSLPLPAALPSCRPAQRVASPAAGAGRGDHPAAPVVYPGPGRAVPGERAAPEPEQCPASRGCRSAVGGGRRRPAAAPSRGLLCRREAKPAPGHADPTAGRKGKTPQPLRGSPRGAAAAPRPEPGPPPPAPAAPRRPPPGPAGDSGRAGRPSPAAKGRAAAAAPAGPGRTSPPQRRPGRLRPARP